MKTPEEILDTYYSFVDDLKSVERQDLLEVIKIAQKDAMRKGILLLKQDFIKNTDEILNYLNNQSEK